MRGKKHNDVTSDPVGTNVELTNRPGRGGNPQWARISPEGHADRVPTAKSGSAPGMGDPEKKDDARHLLQEAVHKEELSIGDGSEILVTKPGDLNIDGLRARIEALRKLYAAHDKSIPSRRNLLASLAADVLELGPTYIIDSMDCDNLERNRFISIFKRDKLGRATEADLRIIGTSDKLIQGGDALADAFLYTGACPRRDFTVYKKLYGFLPETVRRIRHNPTIHILSTHAGDLAAEQPIHGDKFYQLFADFVRAFQETGNGFETNYAGCKPTDTTYAYRALVHCISEDVRAAVGSS
ncbi:unnamed protein product [Tuber aestivum]|uniref:Uncharacterized protein n=1 Tax=Tuber aestivum TaxID=59557 RepID=A0A292PUR6_9PEZI|nr:unnamed protein product [Tuber aestivum]